MGGKVVYPRYYETSVWDSGMEFVSSCGKCNSTDYVIGMRPIVKMKIDALMEEYKGIEWLAYLAGFIDHERGYAEVNDLIIPNEQSISTAAVDDVERDFDAVGVIHSHHSMNFGFSKTDWDNVNSNNDISIVIYNSGRSMQSSMRVRAECGAMTFIAPEIRFVFNEEFDETGFIRDARTKIRRTGIGEFTYGYGGGYGNNFARGRNHNSLRGDNRSVGNGDLTEDEIDREIMKRIHGEVIDDDAPPLNSDSKDRLNESKNGSGDTEDVDNSFYFEE